MTLLVLFGATWAGAFATVVALRVLAPAFQRPPHVRANYRRRKVWGTAGIVLAVPLAIGVALAARRPLRPGLAMLGAGLAMAALGYIDDVYGSRHAQGLRGHARALVRGEVTTGGMKAVGGALVGVGAAWVVGLRGGWIVVGGAVVALAANLANLLDLRPGRTIKVWYPCAIALVALDASGTRELVILAVTGGVSAFLPDELRERIMLGDTGAGLLGAVAGVAALNALGHRGLVVCLAVLLAFTLASELVSFTQVIESTGPLRRLDELGRVKPRKRP